MNKKDILHAPDVEDANYIEEDYMDPEDRPDYEHQILDYENKILHRNQKPELKLSKVEKEAKDRDLQEKVDSSINNAALLL
jgi:hypothetical protein